MQSIQSFATTVLATVVRRQPASPARTAFAWRLAVGPTLAHVTTVEFDGSVLVIRTSDRRWTDEIARLGDLVLLRLQHLLGRDKVTALRFVNPTRPSPQRIHEGKGDRSDA
jgi:predicted nucleic acid-binding Zn ribbon protein